MCGRQGDTRAWLKTTREERQHRAEMRPAARRPERERERETGIGTSTERAPHPPLASHYCGDYHYVKVKVCAPQT